MVGAASTAAPDEFVHGAGGGYDQSLDLGESPRNILGTPPDFVEQASAAEQAPVALFLIAFPTGGHLCVEHQEEIASEIAAFLVWIRWASTIVRAMRRRTIHR